MARIKCGECQWRSLPWSVYRCDYAYLAGVTRIAQAGGRMERPEECTNFKKGPRLLFPVTSVEKQESGALRRPVNYEEMRRLWEEGKTDREIAKLLRCGVCTVGKWRQRNGLEPKHDKRHEMKARIDYVRMRQLYDSGMNDSQIARELGCSNASVYVWRTEQGLEKNWQRKGE